MISEAQQDQASLYALGALDGGEASAFERELAGNAELRELVRDLRDAAASMALSAPAQAAPRGLRDKILREVALEKQGRSVEPGRSWWPWALAAALAVSCAVLAFERVRVGNELQAVRDRFARTVRALTATQNELQVTNRKLEQTRGQLQVSNRDLSSARGALETAQSEPFAGATFYALAPTPDGVKTARATVAWNAERQVGLIKIANLPKPQRGRDYQLWAVDAKHKAPVSAGIIHVNEKGEAEVRFRPTDESREVKAFAISVEREGGSPTKEGPIILVGTA